MGQIAKALERANYLKDLAENIYQYKKNRKLQEMNEALSNKFQEFRDYYNNYLASQKNLQQIPELSTDVNEQNIPNVPTIIPNLPVTQQPTTPEKGKGATKQQQPSQPTQQAQEGDFDITISKDKISAIDKRTENELNNFKNMFADYYKKQNEIMQHAVKLNSFIIEALNLVNSPYLNNDEKNYYVSQINTMSNQFTNLLNMLREQTKIMQFNAGDAQIFASPQTTAIIPETKFGLTDVGGKTYFGGSSMGKAEFKEVYDSNKAKELETRQKEIKNMTENLQKKYSEATNKFEEIYGRISNIFPKTVYMPSKNDLAIETKDTDSKGDTIMVFKPIDDFLIERNLIKLDPYGQGQEIQNIEGLMGKIISQGRDIFNSLGYVDNNDASFYSLTGIPINLKIGDNEINASSVLDNTIIRTMAQNIIEKGNRTKKDIDLYREAETYANRIIDSINDAVFGGEKVFDKHAKSYLTRYYYVTLLANRNNYFRNSTKNNERPEK